jgi:hypothetical protein
MERTKKPCLGVTLLLFLLLVSAAHGARLADAKDVAGMRFLLVLKLRTWAVFSLSSMYCITFVSTALAFYDSGQLGKKKLELEHQKRWFELNPRKLV